MTPEQTELITEYIERFETPIKSFIAIFRSTYKYCLAVGLSHEDIEQECYIGLIIAAQKFDQGTLGINGQFASFSTYALLWIRQSAYKAAMNFTIERGRPKKFEIYSGDYMYIANKSEQEEGIKTKTIFDHLSKITNPDTSFEDDELRQSINQKILSELRNISIHEYAVFCEHTGLIDGRPKTLGETAKVFGCSKDRIRYIEAKVLNKIREPLRKATEHLLDA